MKKIVEWKYVNVEKIEKREFEDDKIMEVFRFQGEIIKRDRDKLEYCIIK